MEIATIIYIEGSKVIVNAITLDDDLKDKIKDFLVNEVVIRTDVTKFDVGQKVLKSSPFVKSLD